MSDTEARPEAAVQRSTFVARFRTPATIYASVAAVLYVVIAVAHSLLPAAKDGFDQSDLGAPSFLRGWVWFDSGWYVSIADHGYFYVKGVQSPVAFFPGYPLVLRALHAVIDSYVWAGLLITVVAGLIAALLWWTWLGDRLQGRARTFAFALLLLYPYAWFLYGTLYSDALFLALVLGAFVLIDRQRWVLGGTVGALAAITRPLAPAVIIGIAAVAIQRSGALQRKRDPRTGVTVDAVKLRGPIVATGLAGAGLLTWCVYLWSRFGDPVAFLTVQSAPGWSQGAGPHTWFKVSFFSMLVHGQLFALRLIPQAIVTVTFLCLVPAVAKRFGWGYGIYVFAVVVIPALGTGDFQGLGRYLLAAFPAFAVLGAWAVERAPRWIAVAALPVSAVCLLVASGMFASGYYLT